MTGRELTRYAHRDYEGEMARLPQSRLLQELPNEPTGPRAQSLCVAVLSGCRLGGEEARLPGFAVLADKSLQAKPLRMVEGRVGCAICTHANLPNEPNLLWYNGKRNRLRHKELWDFVRVLLGHDNSGANWGEMGQIGIWRRGRTQETKDTEKSPVAPFCKGGSRHRSWLQASGKERVR